MSKNKNEKKTIYRSAESGQFVTRKYAEAHPKTTEKERVDKGEKNK